MIKVQVNFQNWKTINIKQTFRQMGTETDEQAHNDQAVDGVEEVLQEEKATLTNGQCFFYLGDTQSGKRILGVFEGAFYSIFISIITLITLFADDIRVIFYTTKQDQSFSVVNLICMAFFFVQITVFSLLKENYFLGFYFWLDLISTSTMVMDLVWINQLLTGGNSGVQTAASVAKVARASRASKIGAKATKLIRIIRLIRFLKLYKTASNQLARDNYKTQKLQILKLADKLGSKQSKLSGGNLQLRSHNKRWTRVKKDSSCTIISPGPKNEASLKNFGVHGSTKKIAIRQKDGAIESIKKIQKSAKKRHTQNIKELAGFQNYFKDFHHSGTRGQSSHHNIGRTDTQFQVPTQTRVGTKVKDKIQKNLIIMILLIIISVPLFNASTWYINISSYEKGIYQLQKAASISSATYDAIDENYIKYMMSMPSTLIYFSVKVNETCCSFPDNYPIERVQYDVTNSEEYRTENLLSFQTNLGNTVVFETTYTTRLTSQLNVGRTLFVCLILIVSTLVFSRDVQIYALQPLQNMFEIVKRIAINPLNAIRQIQEKNMCIQAMEEQVDEYKQEQTQPYILQNLIVKIGGLLAIGFGQAGTQIICKVIEDPNFVNVIIPGQKIMGIYGFCDIRNFTDATQILQADVMVFVNQIAQICHKVVNSHCGSPNKNIGDAFLLVWKYKQNDTKLPQIQGNSKNLELVQTKRVKQLADLAVLSFVRMIAEIAKSYTLQKYKNNKALKKRIKDYKGVKMGFGLHVGWSIEGPIGSQFKVDATYLSPSVNMASRLEAATKQYGVPMLITGQVYSLMTENKRYLRQVDSVIFQGYAEPTDLYTVDLHVDSLIKNVGINRQMQMSKKQKKHKKIKDNIIRNKLLADIQTKYVTKQMWLQKDIKILRQRYSHSFYQQWRKGFDCYVNGQWPEALEIFKRTLIMAPDQVDGPSETLINLIESYQGKAPEDWKGYRQVTF